MKQFFIYLFASLLCCAGCSLESAVDVDLPVKAPQPVVVCFAGPGEPAIAFVSLSTVLNDSISSEPRVVAIQEIRVMEGAVLIGLLDQTATPGLFRSAAPLPLQEGHGYHLEVETLAYGLVRSAVSTLPRAASADSIQLNSTDNNLAGYHHVDVFFRDNATPGDYFAAKALYYNNGTEVVDSTAPYYHIPLQTLEDVAFNGLAHKYQVDVPRRIFNSTITDIETARVIHFTLSHDLFTFISTIQQNEGTNADVLIEPVSIIGNITSGGYGIFGLYQSDTLQLEF
jgi:Domain of unknown function (DUF4249)